MRNRLSCRGRSSLPLWNPTVRYHVLQNLPLACILRRLNRVSILSFQIIFSREQLGLQWNCVCVFQSHIHAIYPANLNVLHLITVVKCESYEVSRAVFLSYPFCYAFFARRAWNKRTWGCTCLSVCLLLFAWFRSRTTMDFDEIW